MFGLLAWAAYLAVRLVPASYERICLSFSRVSLFMVNFGFWIGSLWGDHPGQSVGTARKTSIHILDYVFAVLWAVALAGIGIWAVRANRRFVVNTVAAFGAIHFYTQWFERFPGADAARKRDGGGRSARRRGRGGIVALQRHAAPCAGTGLATAISSPPACRAGRAAPARSPQRRTRRRPPG